MRRHRSKPLLHLEAAVLKHDDVRRGFGPMTVRPEIGGSPVPLPRVQLDEIDIRLLVNLQKDGRISKTALADKVGLSQSACLERMKRLERAKVILHYHSIFNMKSFARLQTFLTEITLRSHRSSEFAIFERYIQSVDEIVDGYAVGGGIDYILKIVCPDVEYYQELMDNILEAQVGIDRYFTYIVTKPVKCAIQAPVASVINFERG